MAALAPEDGGTSTSFPPCEVINPASLFSLLSIPGARAERPPSSVLACPSWLNSPSPPVPTNYTPPPPPPPRLSLLYLPITNLLACPSPQFLPIAKSVTADLHSVAQCFLERKVEVQRIRLRRVASSGLVYVCPVVGSPLRWAPTQGCEHGCGHGALAGI